MIAQKSKLQLEKRAYQQFQRDFNAGKFGSQRFGQAFYDNFKLHRVISQQDRLHHLYQMDGEAAKREIGEIFKFN